MDSIKSQWEGSVKWVRNPNILMFELPGYPSALIGCPLKIWGGLRYQNNTKG